MAALPGPALRRVDVAPKLVPYVHSVWKQRELAVSIARNDLRSQNGGLLLGWWWNLLDPLFLMGVYWLVFGLLLAGRRPDNFFSFLAVGIFLFQFTQRSVTQGAKSVVKNTEMIRQLRFPRALLPLSDVLRTGNRLLWQIPVIVLIVLFDARVFRPGWIVLLFVVLPLLAAFAFGGALVFARLSDAVQDVGRVLPYFFRLAFYSSGVLFPLDALLAEHPLQPFLALNPFYAFVSLARHLVLAPVSNPTALWVSFLTWSLVVLVGGTAFFVRAERRYGRD